MSDNDFYKIRFEKNTPSHDSYDYDGECTNSVIVYGYEPDLVSINLGNCHLRKSEALALIEALKEAVEVMEDW